VANEIKLSIKVADDGSLSVVAKEAKKASKELDKVGNASDKTAKSAKGADRNMKGLSKQSANASKNFSKMQQGMTGGLVPAYAILASNVFALSAAFEFFKRAADLSNLEASQISYAENTGIALGSITQRLREASGGMLGFKESAQAAAIGMAKGFSPAQLEALADGAKRASVALGRNFEDAFDRLIRGASKAEPELLDELGITLRLEDATKKYAASIGKSAKELNTYQRSQAVLIETQSQLEKNFGGMDGAVNPFVRLSKTFDDIIKQVTEFFLPMFQGIANLLSGSATSAIAAFGLLGASIFKTILPMEEMNTKLTDFAANATSGFDTAVAELKEFTTEVKVAQEQLEATKAGGAQDYQAFAKKAIDQGADSPSLKRAAEGKATPQDNARIKTAITAFEKNAKDGTKKVRGMFAKVNSEIVTGLSGAMNRMNAKTTSTFGRMTKRIVVWGKGAKVVFKGVGAAGRIMFVGMAKTAAFAGRQMDRALKFAGVIGIIKLVFDAVMGLAQSPMTVLTGFARMADGIVNFTAPVLDFLAKGFLSMGDSVLNTWNSIKSGVLNIITDIKLSFATKIVEAINSAKEAANGLIETFNIITESNLDTFDLTDPPDPKNYAKVTAEISNMADGYVKINVEGNRFEQMLNDSAIGEWATGVESAADALKLSAQALKAFIESAKSSEKSIAGIVLGLDQAKNGAERGTKAFNGLASSDIGGLFATIAKEYKVWNTETKQFDTKSIMNIQDQASATAELIKRMQGLNEISPVVAAALEKAVNGDSTDLVALSKDITDTNVQLKFFEEGLESTKSSVKDSLAGGDMRKGITALMQLREAGNDAGEGIERVTGQTGKLEELQATFEELFGKGTNTNELLATLIALQEETDAIATSQAMVNGLQGTSKTLLQEELDIRLKTNEIARVRVQLAQAQNDTDAASLSQKLRILGIEERITKQAKIRRLSGEVGAAGGSKTATGGMQFAMNMSGLKGDKAGLQKEQAGLESMYGPLTSEQQERLKSLPGEISAVEGSMKTLSDGQSKDIFKNMAGDFAALGPQGELMSQVSMGMSTVISSVELMGEAGASSAQKMQAGFQIAGAAIATVSGIMNAAHKGRTAAIDAEIAAEKKKDGKSKQSLARIKSLEKKKEDMARKNFEMNKKMQMANVIVSTAAAVAQLYANPMDLTKVWASIMTGTVIAMGAAQLGMIAGTSFQGGGGVGSGGGTPTSVSMGQRGTSSDLGKSQSARGELAYFRGAQGTGGAENFKSAFSGYKHRAAGGNAGYIVGEQGPELFMPDRPGTIVPSDDIAEAGGGGNVSINISAIDASGVESVLMEQRGNIISMLREAANSYGEDFMEDIDESTYTTPAVGRA
jgi:hypothetical protein